MFTKTKDTFILALISGHRDPETSLNLKIKQKDPLVIVSKYTKSTPWWIILVASIAGLLVLLLLTFILYKVSIFSFSY